MKLYRTLMLSVLVAVLLGASVPSASADNPRGITVMTQNLYQGTELGDVIAAQNQTQFVLAVAKDYNNVIATNFAQRADALADEIARSGPALVGLQEVALWRTQFPFNPALGPPQTVSYDFLQILLDALAARGMHYTTVSVQDNLDISGPGLFSFGLMGVRLTDRNAILARTDLSTDELKLSNPQQGSFQHVALLPTLLGPVPVKGSWLSVDAKTHGKTFRFITTRLLGSLIFGAPSPISVQQAQEVLGGPANTTLPTVIVGDFNATTTAAEYGTVVGAGFTDEWATANTGDPGHTAFQVTDLINNPISNLHYRIDYVLTRGPFEPLDLHRVGAFPSARTPSGLWPSDHAGVVARLEIDS